MSDNLTVMITFKEYEAFSQQAATIAELREELNQIGIDAKNAVPHGIKYGATVWRDALDIIEKGATETLARTAQKGQSDE